MTQPVSEPLLSTIGVTHGFGLRGSPEPAGLVCVRQVHGVAIHCVAEETDGPRPVEADAIVSRRPGLPIGVVTADCVPVLLADSAGPWVAAVHAGWRGLTAGIAAAAVARLAAEGVKPGRLLAGIGPHVGPCCYEVDQPVLDAVHRRFGSDGLAAASRPSRSSRGDSESARLIPAGHAWLDLGNLMVRELLDSGLPAAAIGRAASACTACDSGRFHSYRRDGPRSGRLLHWISAPNDRS